MRQIVRQISIYFFTLSILTVVGYLLLVLVYTIPANKFKQSLTESAPFFMRNQIQPRPLLIILQTR